MNPPAYTMNLWSLRIMTAISLLFSGYGLAFAAGSDASDTLGQAGDGNIVEAVSRPTDPDTFCLLTDLSGVSCSTGISLRDDLPLSPSDQVIAARFIGHAVEFANNLTNEGVAEKCRKAPEMFAWVEFKYLDCLNTAYELTGDTQYLDLLRERFKLFYNILRTGTDDYLGWYGSPIEPRIPKENPDVQIDEIQMTFRGISMLSNWIRLARENEIYARQHDETMTQYLSLMEDHLFPKWDARGHFVEIEGRGGVYRGLDFPLTGQPSLSFEKLSIMVNGCLDLYHVTGKDKYLRRALQVGAWFKSCLILKEDHYEWMSWMPGGRWDISPAKEDSWITGWMAPDPNASWYVTALSIALNLYQHGLLFDELDLERFIQTQKSMCWNGDMENPEYRNVAAETSQWIKGRFLSYQLANYDPVLKKLAFHGPHEPEILENSDNPWRGCILAQDYIIEKILRHDLIQNDPQPYSTVADSFLKKRKNRRFLKDLDKPVPLTGREPPRKPSDMFPDL